MVNGSAQPGSFGTTLSVTAESANAWKVERKNHGLTTIIGNWSLSEDGNTLTDDFTSYRPNGTTFHMNYIYKRTASGQGFAGTWESTTQDMSATMEFEIAPIREDGVSLNYTSFGMKKEMLFDGKPYPVVGGNAPAGFVGVARRVGKTGDHLQLQVRQGNSQMKCIAFNFGSLFDRLAAGTVIDLAAEPVINEFNGYVNVELEVKDLQFPEGK